MHRLTRLVALLACLMAATVPALAISGCHSGDDVNVNGGGSGNGGSPVQGDDTKDGDPGDDG